jgi:broad specificity phosphatase PhoE
MDGWDMEDVAIPGGESNADLATRAKKFVGRIVSTGSPGETVLLVGHSDFNREIVRTLLGPEHPGTTRNASLSIFRIEGTDVETELFDSTDHLARE